jgi:hypothetical protein
MLDAELAALMYRDLFSVEPNPLSASAWADPFTLGLVDGFLGDSDDPALLDERARLRIRWADAHTPEDRRAVLGITARRLATIVAERARRNGLLDDVEKTIKQGVTDAVKPVITLGVAVGALFMFLSMTGKEARRG